MKKKEEYQILSSVNDGITEIVVTGDVTSSKYKKMRDELKGKLIKCHFCKCELTPEELIFK